MRGIILLMAVLALTGCVRTSVSALDSRTAIVSGRGTAYDSMAGVQRQMVREAAQQTLARGFTHFVIMNETERMRSSSYRTPVTSYGSGSVNASCTGNFCTGAYSGSSIATGGDVYNFVHPGSDMMVRFFHAGEVRGFQAWSAADVMAATD